MNYPNVRITTRKKLPNWHIVKAFIFAWTVIYFPNEKLKKELKVV